MQERPKEAPTQGGNRCTAHASTTGERCRRLAIAGGNVCKHHGGGAPQVRAKAQLRLLAAADQVAAALVSIAKDRKQPAAARVSACRDILDRAGLKPTEVVEHRQSDLAEHADVAKWRDELAERRSKKASGQ